MKKLTWKELVLGLIPMFAAFVVCFAALYSGSLNFFHFGMYKYLTPADITKYVFLFLFLLCAVVLVVLSFLGLLFGEKFGPVVHLIIVFGVLVIAFALFLTNFIVIIQNMVNFFRHAGEGGLYNITYAFTQLLNMGAWALPLVFSALLTVVYLVFLKKLPKNALIKKVEEFVAEEPAVETQSTESENID